MYTVFILLFTAKHTKGCLMTRSHCDKLTPYSVTACCHKKSTISCFLGNKGNICSTALYTNKGMCMYRNWPWETLTGGKNCDN